MKKIIFLDIDGVLNVTQEGHDKYGSTFNKIFVDNLRTLVNSTGAKIVISSTWRQSGLAVMQEMWKERNLPGEVIDITPDCFTIVNEGLSQFYDMVDRGHEIQYWLDKNTDVTHYVIIDDIDEMLETQKKNFVKTSYNYKHSDFLDCGFGLTKICTEQAIDILNEGDDTTYSITCERDEDGYADTYLNGKKTNVRMLLFDKETIERLQAIKVDYPEPPKEKWYKKALKNIYKFIID